MTRIVPGKIGKAVITHKSLRFYRGAVKQIEAFETVKNLGDEEADIVRSFEDAYDRCVFGKKTSGTVDSFFKNAEKLDEIIARKIPADKREECLRELQKRCIPMKMMRAGFTRDMMEAVGQYIDEMARKGLKAGERAEIVQALTAMSVMSKGKGSLFLAEFLKFASVVPPGHPDLLKAFVYIVEHAPKIRHASGKSYKGHLRNLKGILFEAYAAHSKEWMKMSAKLMREAVMEASGLKGKWTVKRVTGGMYLPIKDVWDEAILIVNESEGGIPKAILYSAAQFKAEKRLSALRQILKDGRRETDFVSHKAINQPSALQTIVSVVENGKSKQYALLPIPGKMTAKRFVVNTKGAGVSSLDNELLKRQGIHVDQLEMDISAEGMEEIADAFVKAVLE